MAAVGETAQHGAGVRQVARLAQDLAGEHDLGVGAEHGALGPAALRDAMRHRARLVGGRAQDVLFRGFARPRRLMDTRRHRLERKPDLAQQLLTARGGGGEINHKVE